MTGIGTIGVAPEGRPVGWGCMGLMEEADAPGVMVAGVGVSESFDCMRGI